MTDKRHRRSMSGIPVMEQSSWGSATARERYGKPTASIPKPEDRSAPQKLGDRNNLRGPVNDHRDDWVRGRGEDATKIPNFLPGYRKK